MNGTRITLAPADGRPGLPLDVASTLLRAIGAVYPNTSILPGPGLTIEIADADRGLQVDLERIEPVPAGPESADLVEFATDGPTISMPEQATRNLAEWAFTVLEATAGAVNYVEQQATHPQAGTLVVTACWSTEQTPHALRMAAEARADELQSELDTARADLAAVLGIETIEGIRPPRLGFLTSEVTQRLQEQR